ncbi:hypothetical protein K1719_027756 [Acacia pycnantha]|nr:hypothetical protein K1719_027756 [Acacia pycnantha]
MVRRLKANHETGLRNCSLLGNLCVNLGRRRRSIKLVEELKKLFLFLSPFHSCPDIFCSSYFHGWAKDGSRMSENYEMNVNGRRSREDKQESRFGSDNLDVASGDDQDASDHTLRKMQIH